MKNLIVVLFGIFAFVTAAHAQGGVDSSSVSESNDLQINAGVYYGRVLLANGLSEKLSDGRLRYDSYNSVATAFWHVDARQHIWGNINVQARMSAIGGFTRATIGPYVYASDPDSGSYEAFGVGLGWTFGSLPGDLRSESRIYRPSLSLFFEMHRYIFNISADLDFGGGYKATMQNKWSPTIGMETQGSGMNTNRFTCSFLIGGRAIRGGIHSGFDRRSNFMTNDNGSEVMAFIGPRLEIDLAAIVGSVHYKAITSIWISIPSYNSDLIVNNGNVEHGRYDWIHFGLDVGWHE